MSENRNTTESKPRVGRKRGKTQERIDCTLRKGERIPFAQPLSDHEKEAIITYLYALVVSKNNYKYLYPVGFIGTEEDCIPILGRIWEKEEGKLKFESTRSVFHHIIKVMGYDRDPAYRMAVNPEVYVATRWGLLTVTQKTTRSAYYKPQEKFWYIKDYFNHSAGKNLYMKFIDETGESQKIRYEKGKKEEVAEKYVRNNKKLRKKYYTKSKKLKDKKYLTFLRKQYDVEFVEEDKKVGIYFYGTLNGTWVLSENIMNGKDTGKYFSDVLKRVKGQSNYVEVTRRTQPLTQENNFLKFSNLKENDCEARTWMKEINYDNVAEFAILVLISANGGTVINEYNDNEFDPVAVPNPYTYPEELKDLF